MANAVMLTTIDNPFDPFTEWDEWFSYDLKAGHQTCQYLARISDNSDDLPENIQEEIDIEAMKEIIKNDPIGLYVMIEPNMILNQRKRGSNLANSIG